MALCDKLEAGLASAADLRLRLIDALLADALARREQPELEAAERIFVCWMHCRFPIGRYGQTINQVPKGIAREGLENQKVMGFRTVVGKVLALDV